MTARRIPDSSEQGNPDTVAGTPVASGGDGADAFQRAESAGVRRRGPQKAPLKRVVTIRLSADVVDAFKATGAGWQTRVDSALKDWLKQNPPS